MDNQKASRPIYPKDKRTAVLLAVFANLFTWLYTYQTDAWKFWLNLVLSILTAGIWLIVSWIWAIVSAAKRSEQWYENFPNGDDIIYQEDPATEKSPSPGSPPGFSNVTADKPLVFNSSQAKSFSKPQLPVILIGSAILFVIVAASISSCFDSTEPNETVTQKAAPSETQEEAVKEEAVEEPTPQPEKPEPKPVDITASLTPKERVLYELERTKGLIVDPVIEKVVFSNKGILVRAKTPPGAFQGTSTTDLNAQVSGIFSSIYGKAGWKKSGTYVFFVGGLIDERTGVPLSNEAVAAYQITSSEARSINWNDSDRVNYLINWSLYRLFLNPSIKNDD